MSFVLFDIPFFFFQVVRNFKNYSSGLEVGFIVIHSHSGGGVGGIVGGGAWEVVGNDHFAYFFLFLD